jgi:class 3 adenylate cyclase/ketosteroid isomerase-like protein
MSLTRSPEIEAVARRILATWNKRDVETMSNLFSSDPSLRVLGFDLDEQWRGPEEFLNVFAAQSGEFPDWSIDVHEAEAFEDGSLGWATLHSTIVTPETETPMRHTAVFRLDGGAWKVVQWHNSIPVSNQQIFGVELTTTLDHLVASVLGNGSYLPATAGSEGTMTLVFTDIVDSTVLAQSVGDFAWTEMIGSHEATIRRITGAQGGLVVKFLGDGSMLAFESARAAIRAAVDIQRACTVEPFAVRIGIHTGEVIRTADDVFGLTVNKAARVAAAADGGGIMVSSTTRDLVGSMEGIRIEEPKIVALKGLSDAHLIAAIEWD